jgi:hypothetical protein
MSTDAPLQEHPVSQVILPRPRRTPKLPALPIPHVPTRSCGDATLAIATCAEGRSHSAYRRPPKREARQSSADHTKARKLTKPRYVTLQVCHVTMMAQSPVSMKPVMLLTKIAVQLYRCGAQQNGTHTGPASKVCLCHGHVIEHVGAEGVPQVSRPLSTDLPTESVDIPFGVNPGAARRYGLTSVWPRRPARDPVNGCANPALRRSQMRT